MMAILPGMKNRDTVRQQWVFVMRIILTSVVLAVVLALIFGTAYGGGFSRIAASFVYGLAYAVAHGTLAWLTMPYLGRRVARMKHVQRWATLMAAFVIFPIAGSLLAGLMLAGGGVYPWSQYWPRFWSAYPIAVVISIMTGSGWFIYESLHYRLRYAQLQARLASLESRLQPHFLFNTLNSISALIPEDPAGAERMTERLAALLRFSLDSTQRRTIPLGEELKIVTDYLEIEKTRFVQRLEYTTDIASGLDRVEVPPFSIQTLVENSVKYGGAKIRVTARNGDGRLVIDIWDSGAGFTRHAIQPGHALDDLQSRLALLWGAAASLDILQEPQGSTVRLSFPITMAR